MNKIAICIFALLLLCACSSGSKIVVGDTRPAISPEEVKLYLEPPAGFEVIALVEASSDAGWTEQDCIDYAVKELKKQAAEVGANGVLLISTGDRTSTMVGGYGTGMLWAFDAGEKVLKGKAIWVSGE